MSARDTALSVLIACRRQQAWSDGVLKEYISKDRLDRRDAAFATQLSYGVLQNRMLIDYWIASFLNSKFSDLHPVVCDILRIAVYQLKFLEKIPASAAVNEAVTQCKKYSNIKAAGLVNAILRNMLRAPERMIVPTEFHLKYSHPMPLVELLQESLGQDKLEPFLKSNNTAPKTCIQVNPLICDTQSAIQILNDEGYNAQLHAWLADCILISGGSIEHSSLYNNGSIYAQDVAAKLAAICSGVKPGDSVLDCCSAPGGKSFAAAIEMKNQGQIISCDLHSHKMKLIENGANRLKLSIIHPMQADASKHNPEFDHRFDVVIADVPCSGFGVIRKKPDIRYKDVSETMKLPELQRKILHTQSTYVKPGGCILYSTCTVLKRENEEVSFTFLKEHPNFSAEVLPLPEHFGKKSMLTLLPCDDDTDGFFIAKFRRND